MLANRPVPKENQTPAVSFYKLLAQSQAVNLSAPRLDPTPSGRTPESEAMDTVIGCNRLFGLGKMARMGRL
ncbi:MAG: hypothetical protein CMJ59_05395 [Planctomycetaceae bacterium]|nr:hypothetical protein [Planctomycetaceae bacterium]